MNEQSPKEKADALVSELRATHSGSKPLSVWTALELATAGLFTVRDDLRERLARAEARITAIEGAQQKNLADAFAGSWLPQRTYRRGALVQHGGSVWLAVEDAGGKPGQESGWRLLVSRGRDAHRPGDEQ